MGSTGRQRWASLALTVAVGITLAGCGSSDGSDADSGSSTPDPTAESSATTSTDASETADDGQSDALAAYVQAGQDQIGTLMDTFGDTYSDIAIDAEDPGTVVYTYVYAQQVDTDAAKKALEAQADTLQSTCDTTLFPDMAKAGITTDPKVRYVYENADESEITTYTCEPS